MSLTELTSRCPYSSFLLEVLKGAPLSLPFSDSSGHLYSLACGSFSHVHTIQVFSSAVNFRFSRKDTCDYI